MGFGEYIKDKKRKLDLYREKKYNQRELQSKLDRERDIEEAKESRVKYQELLKARKARNEIRKYKDLRREEKFDKFSSGMSSFRRNLDHIGKSSDAIFGTPSRKSKKGRGDMFGDINFDGDIFAAPKKKKKRSGNKKKRKRRSFTINY